MTSPPPLKKLVLERCFGLYITMFKRKYQFYGRKHGERYYPYIAKQIDPSMHNQANIGVV